MATQKVRVVLGTGRSVKVEADARYLGTMTGASGSPNIERYDVEVRGRALAGTWDGDARHAIVCESCPADLVAELMPLYKSRRLAKRRKDLAAVQTAERQFYGRELTRE